MSLFVRPKNSECLHLLLGNDSRVAKPAAIGLDSHRLERLLFHSLPVRFLVVHLKPLYGTSDGRPGLVSIKDSLQCTYEIDSKLVNSLVQIGLNMR